MKAKRKTAKITGLVDAEARARQLIKDRHRTVRQILLRKTLKEGDVWFVEGEVWLKKLYFFTARKSFRLQISVENGELTSYEEESPR